MARIIDGKETNIVGKQVRRFRLERKMSQKTLSEKLETLAVYICRGSIARIESGKRFVTDIELKAFSEIFGVSVDNLI